MMTLKYLQWRSLKTRVTLFTLLIFVISTWLIAFYVSRMLREDMQIVLGEQQFSTVSGIAREIDGRLSDCAHALQTIAKEVTPKVPAWVSKWQPATAWCEPPWLDAVTQSIDV